jgi:hypothetical protein
LFHRHTLFGSSRRGHLTRQTIDQTNSATTLPTMATPSGTCRPSWCCSPGADLDAFGNDERRGDHGRPPRAPTRPPEQHGNQKLRHAGQVDEVGRRLVDGDGVGVSAEHRAGEDRLRRGQGGMNAQNDHEEPPGGPGSAQWPGAAWR